MVQTTMKAACWAGILAGALLPGCVAASKYMKLQDDLAAAEEERDYALENLTKAESMLSDLHGDQAELLAAQDEIANLEAENARLAAQFDDFRTKHAALSAQGIETVMLPEDGMIGYRAKGDVLFSPGSADLTNEGKNILNTVAAELRQNDLPIRVDGHTDADPIKRTADIWTFGNIQLGARRAISVRAYLIEQGVAEERMTILSHGPFQPVAVGNDADSKARNRRVEILMKVPKNAG